MLFLIQIINKSIFIFVLPAPTFNPDISFASYYDDNMVLQKAPDRSILWGYAKRPGIEVKIFLDHSLSASVRSYYHWSAKFSMWKAKLPPMKPGGPHTIIVLSSKVALSLNNVLFGDVWICSGQSNMQFTTNMVRVQIFYFKAICQQ